MDAQQPSESPTRAPYLPRFNPIMLGLMALTLVAFVIVPGILMAITPHPHGLVYDDPPLIADFEMPRADGGTFRLSDYRGKTVVVYFGYTSCPDVCPATLYNLHRALERLGSEADKVQVVFVTVDPQNDTPERIREYLRYFDPSFIGLYGTQEQLQAVWDAFGVVVQREETGQTARGYTVTHTTSIFVVDSEGYLKLRMHYDTNPDLLARDLRYVIRRRI